MKKNWTALLAATALVLGVCFGTAGAQTTPPVTPPPQPAAAPVPSTQPLPEGWEEIDTRVVFFTTQLATTEALLDALDKVLRQLGYKMVYRDADAARYDAGNENMDRNGGGPVPWSDFYGTTARRFYYHDTPWLTKQIQRPPQFDYIYKANEQRAEQARQEVAALGRKLDALVDRKHQVENQQSALWARIAFRIIVSQSLADKALYRFDFKDKDIDPQRLEALRASCELIRQVNALVDRIQDVGENRQGAVYKQMIQVTRAARKDWDSRVIHQPELALDVGDIKTPLGKLTAALKRMEDAAKNVDDAFRLAAEGDRASDLMQKNTSRRLMQASLIDYADTLLTAHNTLKQLAQDWHTEPDPAKPIETAVPIVADSGAARISTVSPGTAGSESVYLSSLTEKLYHGSGDLGKDGDLVYVNKPITVNGTVAKHGLSTLPMPQAYARVVYDLQSRYLTLSGTVALNDDVVKSQSPLLFRIEGDGTVLWRSKPIHHNGETDSFQVNVEGVKQLQLIVHCPGGNQYCHAVWVDPTLTTLPAAPAATGSTPNQGVLSQSGDKPDLSALAKNVTGLSRDEILQMLPQKTWFWHWERENRDRPTKFTVDDDEQIAGGEYKQKWKLELRWVINDSGNLLIPIDRWRWRGFFITTGRQVGIFTDPSGANQQSAEIDSTKMSRDTLLLMLVGKTWFWHWEQEDRNHPVKFAVNDANQLVGGDSNQKWNTELRWVLNDGSSLLIPIDHSRFRGIFVATGRQIGMFADKPQ